MFREPPGMCEEMPFSAASELATSCSHEKPTLPIGILLVCACMGRKKNRLGIQAENQRKVLFYTTISDVLYDLQYRLLACWACT